MTHIQQMAEMEQRIEDAWSKKTLRTVRTFQALRKDLTEAEKIERLRIGRIHFESARTKRK